MKDARGHGSNAGPRRPIPDHPFHSKSDVELRYIQKDAHEAGRNAQEMGDQRGINKYADQVNDASTVLGYRRAGGTSDAPSDQLHSGTSKSDPAPVHDSMIGVGPNSPLAGSRDYDPFGRPRADKASYDEGTRDLQLRSRNGQIGSGMKFRG